MAQSEARGVRALTGYVAMLRGINVAGRKPIPMERLRASFEALGFTHVRTYVQSGNVVFKAAPKPAATLARLIEERIAGDFGFAVSVLLKTAGELNEIMESNPFLEDQAIDRSKLHVTFLSKPARAPANSLDALVVKPERLHIKGRAIYLYCPNGYGRTKLSNNALEKKLSAVATTRNWRTVAALLAMARED